MSVQTEILVSNIQQIAKRQNITIKQLEIALGIGNGVIGRWKAAQKMPSLERVEAIADYLGVSVDDLTGKKEERPVSGTPNRDALLKFIAETDDVSTLLKLLDAVNRKLQERQ